MKFLPMLAIGGAALYALSYIKRNGFPGSDKAARIKDIELQMAEAMNAGNNEVYELLRLELENEREL